MACILKPNPRPLFWIFMTGRGVPGTGEKERPGEDSRELGFERMDDGGKVERGLANGEGGKLSSTFGIKS